MERIDGQHDFSSIHEVNNILIRDIEGETLKYVRVHTAVPEIDIVFLHFEDYVVEVFGAVGSEILKVEISSRSHDVATVKLPILEAFEEKRINQIRIIGEAWNGYGFEISFDEPFDKTLLIQSIYCGHKPEGFEDCLRIGIGHYIYRID